MRNKGVFIPLAFALMALFFAATLARCGGGDGAEDAGKSGKSCKTSNDCIGGGSCVAGFCQGGALADAGQAGGDTAGAVDDAGAEPDGATADVGPTEDGGPLADTGADTGGGPVPDGGPIPDAGQACDSNTCPSGCCDSGGNCVGGSSDKVCGRGGTQCDDCTASQQTCKNNICTGGTSCTATCSGCCDASAACQPGNLDAVCGTAGAQCTDCSTGGSTCQAGACKGIGQCNINCTAFQGGCCDPNDICVEGTSNTACGGSSSNPFDFKCDDCTRLGNLCVNRKCGTPACNASTCATGCCDLTMDKCTGGTFHQNCGKGGIPCVNCTLLGQACANQQCQ